LVTRDLDEDELKDEQDCEDIHHGCDLLEVAADHVQDHICDHSYEDTV
jgi:hypothetical protein